VFSLALCGAKRQLGCPPGALLVGKPHGAEGGYDPHSAYQDITEDDFFHYLFGDILPPEEPGEWVRAAVCGCRVCCLAWAHGDRGAALSLCTPARFMCLCMI
jgi:hypothetical protein